MAKVLSKSVKKVTGIKKNVAPKQQTALETHYIVGIGASAGGLEAIHEFFDHVPDNTNCSFIIIQHLSPDYKSMMADLLTKHTKMRVMDAAEGMPVKPNHVYVIPTKKVMTIREGKLYLTEKADQQTIPNLVIDT